MSSIRTLLTRRDTCEGRYSAREQTRKVQQALKSLNPSFTRLQPQRNRSLSHRSSFPCLSPSTTPPDETLQERRENRSQLSAPNMSHLAQQPPRVDDPSISLSDTVTQSSPTPPALVLELSLSPPQSSPTKKRRRFSVMSFGFGEALNLFPEPVIDADITISEPRNACDGVQTNALDSVVHSDQHEGTILDLHIITMEERSGDHPRPSIPVTQNAENRTAQRNFTTWTLEKNGRRIDLRQQDYQLVLEFLRGL